MFIIKLFLKKIRNLFVNFINNDKKLLQEIAYIEISNIDFFSNKKVIYIKDNSKNDTYIELIDVENYTRYYKKDLIGQIIYRKKKINSILLTYNKKYNNNFYTIYKATLEFHFFLTKCVRSKNDIFIQFSFTAIDIENIKLIFFSNKIILKNNENIDFEYRNT